MSQSPSTRRRGRPPRAAHGDQLLSRQSIAETALGLARDLPLSEISVVRLSAELGVSAAAIHYHVKGRDGLTSNILNAFYKKVYLRTRSISGSGQEWVRPFAKEFLNSLLIYKGIPAYLMTENKFRIVQDVQDHEQDYGALLFETALERLAESGVSNERLALFLHLLLQHVLGSAHASVAAMLPSDTAAFLLSRLGGDVSEEAQGILTAFSLVGLERAFDFGLDVLVASVFD